MGYKQYINKSLHKGRKKFQKSYECKRKKENIYIFTTTRK